MRLAVLLVGVAAAATSLPALADPFTVTYEQPGVQNTTARFSYSGVETFDGRPTGSGQSFTTSFGATGTPAVITGRYSKVSINSADQFGSADGSGNYAVTYDSTGYSLSLSVSGAGNANLPITYFGYWLSALDGGNDVAFYRGNTLVYPFNPANVASLIGACPNAYCGNPTTHFLHQDSGEPFVFLNFYDTDALGFDRIVFSENPQIGGYESDNHTVGYYTSISGTPVAVPEPASVALLGGALAGFALLRRRWKPRP